MKDFFKMLNSILKSFQATSFKWWFFMLAVDWWNDHDVKRHYSIPPPQQRKKINFKLIFSSYSTVFARTVTRFDILINFYHTFKISEWLLHIAQICLPLSWNWSNTGLVILSLSKFVSLIKLSTLTKVHKKKHKLRINWHQKKRSIAT